MKYRVFRPTYTDKATGAKRQSLTYHITFRDHLNRRQSFAGEKSERQTHAVAGKLEELVNCRRHGDAMPDKLRKWVDTRSPREQARLMAMDLLTSLSANVGLPLKQHLDGVRDDVGDVTRPGWWQELASRRVTVGHVDAVTNRVETLLEGCGLMTWQDLIAPGTDTRVTVWLGTQREAGKINGTILNYYVRDLRSFCRWLGKRLERPAPLADLRGVENAASDAEARRSLSVAEMRLLLAATSAAPVRGGVTGEDRALACRFAFETGMRPGQIRALTVADFDFDAAPPTVRTHARHVKRRKEHTQVLRPALAADLMERFKTKLPAAAAFRLRRSSTWPRCYGRTWRTRGRHGWRRRALPTRSARSGIATTSWLT